MVENSGDVKIAAGQGIDTLTAGALNLGTTNATSAVLGSVPWVHLQLPQMEEEIANWFFRLDQ